MLRVQSTSIIAIDHKWVALLVGICMKVPNDWWPYVSGQTLNTGVIAGVNFDINTNNHIQLELDKERGIYYAMHYDAIVLYANKAHPTFSLFCLPAYALCDPMDDIVEDKTVNDKENDNEFYQPPPCTRNKQRRLKKNHNQP
jgi:hypothetical protein